MPEKQILFMEEKKDSDTVKDAAIKRRLKHIIFKENLKNLKGLSYVYIERDNTHCIYAVTDDA